MKQRVRETDLCDGNDESNNQSLIKRATILSDLGGEKTCVSCKTHMFEQIRSLKH